jgi:pyrroline-5-carboxylate reductase
MTTKEEDIPRVLLVGAGKMGGALLDAWLKQKTVQPRDIVLVEPDVIRAKYYRETYSLYTFETPEAVNTGLGRPIVLFAVKPQIMDEVAPLYRNLAEQNSLILSIAAGKTTSYFEKILGTESSIVRAMPNIPASIGKGITVLYANNNVDSERKKQCETLLHAVGEVRWVDNEELMDPVTAVSGSGPAYVFLLIEALAEAGVEAGLDPTLAHDLALTTVAGAGALAEQSTLSPSTLRGNVTSPGGTTEAALQVLMAEDGMPALFSEAIRKATVRSKALAD